MKNAVAVPVLMYHHVSPNEGMVTTSPRNFESQLAWLARHGYRTLSSGEFADHLAGRGVPDRSILITFDDGYLDNWVYAYPLLKKYGFRAMIFIVTSWIGEGPVRPHIGGPVPLPATPSHTECRFRIQQGDCDRVMLRWSEIRAMMADGTCEFHSHTHTHTRWDRRDGGRGKNAHMARELALSRRVLGERLDSVSSHFCWPQGYFDEDYIEIARDAGFHHLYTTRAYGQNRPGSDPARIHRFAVRDTPGAALGRRVRIASDTRFGPLYNRWRLLKRKLQGRE